MADWYEEGYAKLITDVSEITKVQEDIVERIYSHLVDIGIIDYDIEKEVISDLYGGEEEE